MNTENKLILSACKELDLSPEIMLSGLREKDYMDCKRICVGLLLENKISLNKVKLIVGLTNHTSVMYLRNSYRHLIKTDPAFRIKCDRVKGSLVDAQV